MQLAILAKNDLVSGDILDHGVAKRVAHVQYHLVDDGQTPGRIKRYVLIRQFWKGTNLCLAMENGLLLRVLQLLQIIVIRFNDIPVEQIYRCYF